MSRTPLRPQQGWTIHASSWTLHALANRENPSIQRLTLAVPRTLHAQTMSHKYASSNACKVQSDNAAFVRQF